MNPKFAYKHDELQTKAISLNQEVEDQINTVAQELLKVVNVPKFRIDLGIDSLLVGDYEPALGRCPLLDSIVIELQTVSVRVELNNEFHPLSDFETFDILDKLSILSVLENQLSEFVDA